MLNVVQHELDKFDFALLRRAGIRIGHRPHCGRGSRSVATQDGEEVGPKKKAQNDEHQSAADTEVHSVEAAEVEPASAALAATIFNIRTVSAWCPPHVHCCCTGRANVRMLSLL